MRIFLLVVGLSLLSLANAFAQSSNLCLTDVSSLQKEALSLKEQGQYLLSSQKFSLIQTFACSPADKTKAKLSYAQNLYLLGEKSTAEQELFEILKNSPFFEESRKSLLTLCWYEPNFRFKLDQTDLQSFERFEREKQEFEKAHQHKKPWIAGLLSTLVPGAGQLYNGNLESAALSFVINGLFLATVIELTQKKLNAPALAAGVIFSITYTGNIFGSIHAAKEINRLKNQNDLVELQKKIIPDLNL